MPGRVSQNSVAGACQNVHCTALLSKNMQNKRMIIRDGGGAYQYLILRKDVSLLFCFRLNTYVVLAWRFHVY